MTTRGEAGGKKNKKKKKKSGRGAGGGSLGQPMVMEPELEVRSGEGDKEEVWLYHPEDELIASVRSSFFSFPHFPNPTLNLN